MTGAILGGSSVQQAARLQMIIVFMLCACTALSSIVCTLLTLRAVIDDEMRVRSERVDVRKARVWRIRDAGVQWVAEGVKRGWGKMVRRWRAGRVEGEESRRLLG